MQIAMYIGVGAATLLLVYAVVTNVRFLHTVTLIMQASPYEQSGEGAGTILIIGDSTGYGTGATDPRTSIAGLLGADFPRYKIENRSRNGDTISDALERIDRLEQTYELILLQLGGNDILQQRSQSAIRSDLTTLYDRIRPATNHVVMLSAGNVGAATAFTGAIAEAYTERTRAFHALVEEFAAERSDFTYVNLYEAPAEDPFVAKPEVYLARDGLHPSAAGYAVWYEKLFPVLQARLRSGEETAGD